MTTTIHWNGSKWHGEAPDTVEQLIEVMRHEPLDRERFKRFCYPIPGGAGLHFFGNFANVSHAFSIESDDPAVCDRLIAAIRANPQSPLSNA